LFCDDCTDRNLAEVMTIKGFDWRKQMGVTFKVGLTRDKGDVAVAEEPVKRVDQIALLGRILKAPVDACSRLKDPVAALGTRHQLLEAVQWAHARHYPLVLSPDAVWLTIAQGLANHVNANAEKLRRRFVAHDGKKKIVVRRDEFLMGSPENAWVGAFGEFSARIRESIGDANHAMVVADFSTTGPVERAASEVVLMDTMQSYFSYGMVTSCGIPSITLEGTAADWRRLRAKVDAWDGLDLEWWTGPLKSVLDRFVRTAEGCWDRSWWNDVYNAGGGSGPSRIGGWFTWLFPYVGKKADRRNEHVGILSDGWSGGVEEGNFPSSLSRVPFEWDYHGAIHQYEFLAGLTGVEQGDDLALRPVVGWAVRKAVK
jgi:hypothetical protein